MFQHGKRFGFEIKYADAPRLTRSVHVALDTLSLERVFMVHPGSTSYPLHARVEALALADAPSRLGTGRLSRRA